MITLLLILSSFQTTFAHAGPDDVAYFNQFIFQKESISTDPDFPMFQYRYLTSRTNTQFVNSKNQAVTAITNLQLFADGHYEMRYEELVQNQDPNNPSGPPILVPGCKFLKGAWSVPDTLLVLDGVGTGGQTYDATAPTPQEVQVTFNQNFLSTGLSGNTATLTYGVQPDTGFGSDLSMYCFSF